MEPEEFKQQVSALLPAAVPEEGTEWLTLQVENNEWLSFAHALRTSERLQMNYLFNLTCVDWKTHLSMIYHLSSTLHRQSLCIKVKLDAANPAVESVCGIWRTAEFQEREVYEMFGVNFLNHPDLRLLILPDGWEGRNPLRKDFDDPINMIRL